MRQNKHRKNQCDSLISRYHEARENLEFFYKEKTKGIIRARARWHEHGEKSTKYFLNLEKRNEKEHTKAVHKCYSYSVFSAT